MIKLIAEMRRDEPRKENDEQQQQKSLERNGKRQDDMIRKEDES